MEITTLKSSIQDSKLPKEARAREETPESLTTNYTAGPIWSACIVVATSAPSNRTTFEKGPLYKETPRDQKRGEEEKNPSTAAIAQIQSPPPSPFSTINIAIVYHLE